MITYSSMGEISKLTWVQAYQFTFPDNSSLFHLSVVYEIISSHLPGKDSSGHISSCYPRLTD